MTDKLQSIVLGVLLVVLIVLVIVGIADITTALASDCSASPQMCEVVNSTPPSGTVPVVDTSTTGDLPDTGAETAAYILEGMLLMFVGAVLATAAAALGK